MDNAGPDSEPDVPHSGIRDTTDRFEFGHNWRAFLSVLDEDRIIEAERSLQTMLGVGDLRGLSFIDVGSGSGLFSLAAVRLGAARVHSFDFDPSSVACTRELKRRFEPRADPWTIERASVLDDAHVASLGTWDVVYSWGVLHHTGAMADAFRNVERLVAPGGRLFVSVYNDQGVRSDLWRVVKRTYNRLPARWRVPYAVGVMAPREMLALGYHCARLRPMDYVRSWTRYRGSRGMSRWHDLIDWVGGYPFEVAKPEEVLETFRLHDLQLDRLKTCQGKLGCNEFVFVRDGLQAVARGS